jgi:hypothetical protein
LDFEFVQILKNNQISKSYLDYKNAHFFEKCSIKNVYVLLNFQIMIF